MKGRGLRQSPGAGQKRQGPKGTSSVHEPHRKNDRVGKMLAKYVRYQWDQNDVETDDDIKVDGIKRRTDMKQDHKSDLGPIQ